MLTVVAPSARELELPPIGDPIRHREMEVGGRAVDFKV